MTYKQVFVAMPFGIKKSINKSYKIDFNKIYEEAIKPLSDEMNISITRADEETDNGIIHVLMFERLICSDIVIVDLTNQNPNVYYELGIRHCARPYSTILIYDKNALGLPFDISISRAIGYELDNGIISPESAAELRENLKIRIQQALCPNCSIDSLPFSLIKNFPPTNLDESDLEMFKNIKEKKDVIEKALSEIESISEISQIIEKIKEEKISFNIFVFQIIKAYQKLDAWQSIIDFINKYRDDELKVSLYVKQQLAHAYKMNGTENDLKCSIKLLKEIQHEYGIKEETSGLLGAAYKKLMLLSSEETVKIEYLNKAIENYKQGFNIDTRNFYTGINFATLQLYKSKNPNSVDLLNLLSLLEYNLNLNVNLEDYWYLATKYELLILKQNFLEAREIISKIKTMDEKPLKWEIASTLGNLSLIKEVFEEKQIDISWYEQFNALKGTV